MRGTVFENRAKLAHSMKMAVLAGALLTLAFSLPRFAAAGPLMLAGHDADDHGFEAVYADLFDELLANVSNGNSGILAIGADPGTTAATWIQNVAAQMTVPQTVTFVNGAAITTQDFSNFALIHVPSTVVDLPDGGITLAENSLLAARALDISDFINDGGGLFGLTQDSATDAYDYLGLFAGITATPVPSSGVCDGSGGGQLYDNITATSGGNALGITNTNVDGCCWHNTFASFAPFLQVLAIADEPGCSNIDTQAAVIGCLQCSLPGQKSLSPAVSSGLPAANHTVTATLLESLAPNDPVPGVLVTFNVTSGPNAGANGTDTTNASGQAEFTYSSNGTPGVDVITSTCTDPVTSDTIDSNPALRFWDLDCNGNGVADTCDIDCAGFGGQCATYGTCGASADVNSNGIPDDCAICGNSTVEPGEDCDDGNTANGDCCSSSCAFESAGSGCGDGDACNGNELCDGAGTCDPGTNVDCSHLDAGCFSGACVSPAGTCQTVVSPDGAPCDDGQSCTILDVCTAGICAGESPCGNGSIEGTCGEECDPPDGSTCDPTCQNVECGDASVQIGEECDDGNTASGDGCSAACQFEEKFCIVGESPAVARVAKRVAFISDEDYVGTNADGNNEVFFFDKRILDKVIKKAVARGEDAATVAAAELAADPAKYFRQLTNTTAPVVNEMPSINGNGRVVAYVSTGDPLGANADASPEIFRLDRKRFAKGDPTGFLQITAGDGTSSLHPNLRAAKGTLLIFDSNADLIPDRCVGGANDLQLCTSGGDCPDGDCGNPESNREVFAFLLKAYRSGGIGTRQLTADPTGDSEVGQSVNFSTSATAFSSTADLLGTNPEGNAEIFQVAKGFDSLTQLTSSASGTSFAPAQSKRRRVAFASTSNFTGANPDANAEIFLWSLTGSTADISQPFMSGGCSNNAPSIDSRGRFIAFHSSCNLIPSSGNPDQSIFIWDNNAQALLPLVVRGPTSSASARPQATKRVRVLTFEGNLGAADPAICFLNARDELLEVLSP